MRLNSLRILPLLITVAMMAFTVRLAEVAWGISALAGEAMAEEKATEKPADKKAEKQTAKQETLPPVPPVANPEALKGSMDSDTKGALQFPDAAKADSKGAAPPDNGKDKPIGWKAPTDTEIDYSKTRHNLENELAARRDALEKRERDLETREALLKAGEQEADRKMQELTQLKTQIEGLLKQQSDEEGGRIASLVKIYEGMKPGDAARIFDSLDINILIDVMSKMSERKLSPIMAAMNPDKAKTVTVMLAEQKKLPELSGN